MHAGTMRAGGNTGLFETLALQCFSSRAACAASFSGEYVAAAALQEWVSAHGRFLQEETRLFELADRVAAQTSTVEELEEQRARLIAAQDVADALYESAMEKLREG